MIVGTNVLRLYKSCTEDQMPTAWQLAIDSMDVMATVKSTNKKPVHVYPNESIVLNGIAINVDDLTEVITENCDSELNYLVCPRVLKFGRSAKVQKVPVKICNITAKTITIRPKSDICSISPVKVVDSLASETSDSDGPACRKESIPVDLGVNIDKDNLSANQVENVHELLSFWKHVFSLGPLDIGKTDLVTHTIELEDERPFKQPYRRIPPGMYDEVRQHLK